MCKIGKVRSRDYSHRKNRVTQYELYGYEAESLKFRDFIYYDGCFSLKRKKDIFFFPFAKSTGKQKPWTSEELKFLLTKLDCYYSLQEINDIASLLGRSFISIKSKLRKLKLEIKEATQ